MRTTFIGHSGFFVELDRVCLLFDYYEGRLPEAVDKPLYIFVSHVHHDHFNSEIFAYGEKWKEVHYILASDIGVKVVPKELRESTLHADAGKHYVLSPTMEFDTFESTDEGNAYLVHVTSKMEDKLIYHAGDLHLWLWDESEEEDREMRRRFEEQMAFLEETLAENYGGRAVDAGFLVLDPRQQYLELLGIDYILQKIRINRIYPMHCWGKYEIIDRLIQNACSEEYRDRIVKINMEGQTDEI